MECALMEGSQSCVETLGGNLLERVADSPIQWPF